MEARYKNTDQPLASPRWETLLRCPRKGGRGRPYEQSKRTTP